MKSFSLAIYVTGDRKHPFYSYQKPVVQSVLGLHNPLSSKEYELVQYRTRCGGLGRLSITPIERYGPISTLLPMRFSSR